MTRGDTARFFTLLCATALAIAALAACGGSDSDSETTGSAPATTQESGTGAPSGNQASNGNPQKSDAKTDADSAPESSGGAPGNVVTPLKVSGGGSEQFRFKGGDNSIQEYGDESDESELREVAEIVHGFYVARAEEKWDEACSYLAQSMVGQLETLASQSPELKGQRCGPVLEAFTRPLPAAVRRETTVVDAGSFRDDGDRGFLIYYDSKGEPFAIPLEDEDGEWKLTLLSATPLG